METITNNLRLFQIEHCQTHHCESIHNCLVTLECNCPHIICDHKELNENPESAINQETTCCNHDQGFSGESLTFETDFLVSTIEACKHCPNCNSHVNKGFCDKCRIYLGFN